MARRFVAGALCGLLTAVSCAGATTPSAAAQATPVAAVPDVPQPDECRVEPQRRFVVPREVPPAGPAAPPAAATPATGTPPATVAIDDEVVTAITATVRESLACRNAGDLARAYALLTDELVLDLLGSAETVPPEIAVALGQPPQRVPRAARLELVAIGPATALPDGRVLARVETRSADVVFIDDLVFREVDGRWLVDDVFPVVGGRE